MSDIQTLRQKAINQSQGASQKARFGLFSHPLSTAVGDNGQYKSKLHARDEQGKPVTQPRNFQTSPPKKGQEDSTYFGKLNPLATSGIKDPYVQPGRRAIIQEKQKYDSGRKPDQPAFKFGATALKTISTSVYQYKQQKPLQRNPKKYRKQDGTVIAGPRNFYTNTQKKILNSFFKPIQYQSDPYDRAHKIEVQNQKRNKSLEAQSAFKPNSFSPQKFNTDLQAYGTNVQPREQVRKQPKLNIYAHEKNWKASSPNKSGLFGYFSPFPQYMENPLPEVKRKAPNPDAKQSFKSMSQVHSSQPSPSISKNTLNLRKIANIALRH